MDQSASSIYGKSTPPTVLLLDAISRLESMKTATQHTVRCRFLSPYYMYYSPHYPYQNVICLHRIEGIQDKAYVAFSSFNGYFTVSDGTNYEKVISSDRNPVHIRQLDGTNSLLLNYTGHSYYELKYPAGKILRIPWRIPGDCGCYGKEIWVVNETRIHMKIQGRFLNRG